jgi:hypothetical protein
MIFDDAVESRIVTAQVARIQGSRVWGSGKKQLPGPACRKAGLIAAGPNRPCGRMAKTMAPALVDFLNPEP